MPKLILASTSPYRRELLGRLGLPFETARPEVDEAPQPGEPPAALARRLAAAKARAVAARHPEDWVIGSDQVADLDGRPLGKPGDHARAVAQLRATAGREVRFHTGLCLLRGTDDEVQHHLDLTVVRFRPLDVDEIERYLRTERPYDCAGSFKCEGLGITLFEAIESRDPTALIGLPLIALAGMLRRAGFAVP
ncbi:Maf family protein [Rehaibacterium terrae]|jgi:septum formation protein|uniref:7-methyl-GTP pyrophosphatase n=1 Tax=Rehaibacterium terrae TaxID=1341696 RepID=A0A7W7XZD6_9GAMM|nr:Maf family nucleotide pyrophosphatase [Rehaibacterium terrae]MBB5015245.1 septum formation protein [Rehaibacterium terrae]